MPKLTSRELKVILAAERQDALASGIASDLTTQRTDAIDYYNGDVSKDMPALEGRSQAVSNDVRDCVEGLMPSLMDIFCGSDDVVRFDPVGPEDVDAAQQETDFCNYVFMQQNDGFVVLYQMIKDALLSKTGIAKIWWEEKETDSRETYYDLPEDAYGLLKASDEWEIVEHTENIGPPNTDPQTGQVTPTTLHDVTIKVTKDASKCCVEPVPPEEFGISRRARVCLQDASYMFHEPTGGKPLSDLVDEGFDADQLESMASYAGYDERSSAERWARDTVNESSWNEGDATTLNKVMRPIRITEHYIKMDYEGDGVARRYRVTTGGEDSDVLLRNGKPDIEELEWWPFAAMSPIINPHRFIGLSIADTVMDIQRIKTALTRGFLDNIYFAVNPRPVVSEAEATPETLDDIMRWRQGDPIRVKANAGAAIAWQQVPDITGSIYPALQYFDSVREWRTGVSRQGQGLDADALSNQTATAAMQLYNASQARMKLIARIFAETGIPDLFWLIHSTVRKYGSQAATIKLRNNWVTVDPRQWKTRTDMTIDVGLGRGGKAEETTAVMGLISLQKAALEGGMSMLVNPKQLYNSAADYCKVIGKKDVDRYFTDPGDNAELPQPQPDPAIQIAQMKMQADQQKGQQDAQLKGQELQMKGQLDSQALQMKAGIEKVQAEADIATQQQKTQSEAALAQQRFELERELKLIDAQMAREKHQMDLQQKQAQGALSAVTTSHKMEMSEKAAKAKANGPAASK